jgi:hypothetical protein
MSTEQSAQANTSDANTTRAKLAAVALAPSGLLALGLSAQTSYRYLGTMLAVTQTWERFALCGVAESAILGFTVYAALTRTKFPAYLAYAVVLVQTIPAYSLSGGSGGTVRVALGPVLLAVVLHFLLGISKKVNRTRSTGLFASAGREIRERITARLGIGRRGADSAAIHRSRAADRAVKLAAGRKLSQRAAVRLAVAVDAAQHGLGADEAAAAEASIVDRVVRRKSVAGLHAISVRHVWHSSLAPFQIVPGTVPGADEETAQEGAEPVLQALAPVLYPLPERPALPSFQTVPGSSKPQVVPFPSDEERARAMRDKGLSFGEIAERLERSKSWAFRACSTAVPHANGSNSTD